MRCTHFSFSSLSAPLAGRRPGGGSIELTTLGAEDADGVEDSKEMMDDEKQQSPPQQQQNGDDLEEQQQQSGGRQAHRFSFLLCFHLVFLNC